MDTYIDDPEALTRDYICGRYSPSQVAVRHNLTLEEVQEFAIDNNLPSPSLGQMASEGVQLRAAYQTNGPQDLPLSPGNEIEPFPAPENRQDRVHANNRSGVDSLYTIAHMTLENLTLRLRAIEDPLAIHPNDMRLRAAQALQGERESFTDQLLKTIDAFDKIRSLGMRDANLLPEPASAPGGINLTQNTLNVGANRTAIDPQSKLAAVAGMLSILRERRDNDPTRIIEHDRTV